MAAEDEGDGPVAALLRDGLDAEAAAPPSVMSAVNTSWDASAERAALRDNLNAYLTREAAAYSGKENQWKSTQGEKSELAATQAKLLREAEELRRREELALVAKRERDAREQDRKRATDEREAALGALSQTLESHFTRLGDDEAKAARRQAEIRARSDEAAAPSRRSKPRTCSGGRPPPGCAKKWSARNWSARSEKRPSPRRNVRYGTSSSALAMNGRPPSRRRRPRKVGTRRRRCGKTPAWIARRPSRNEKWAWTPWKLI
jgi:hypothetical protein